jgi:protein disulfide-isomerase
MAVSFRSMTSSVLKFTRTLFTGFFVAAAALSMSAKPGWLEDYEKGKELGKKDNKLVLVEFTGSDWCGWCIKLDKEILSKTEFKEFAKKNLVLVELDFPKNKSQSTKTKETNKALREKYGVRGYPTIIVLNSEGKKVGELGYVEGGPEAFIAEVKKLQEKSS